MRKKGFVLVETIIVLVVVLVSMIGLYKTYYSVLNNLNQNKYYDNINDLYKINTLKKTFINGYPADDYKKILKADCTTYMSEDCGALYDLFSFDYIIYNSVDVTELLSGVKTDLTNTDVNYIKYLQDNHKYLIVHYEKNSKDYYASLSVGVME